MNAGAARELCVPLGENGAADARVAGRKAASSRGLRDGEILTVDGAASLVRSRDRWTGPINACPRTHETTPRLGSHRATRSSPEAGPAPGVQNRRSA